MANNRIIEFQRFFREGLDDSIVHKKYGPVIYTKSNIDKAADELKNHFIKTYDQQIAELQAKKKSTVTQITNARNQLFAKLGISNRKKTIPKAVKDACWDKYFGPFYGTHLCYCCKKKTISKSSFHAGHVIAEANGGQPTIANLRPICATCNSSMGTKNMDIFIREHGFHQEQISKQSPFQSIMTSSSMNDFSLSPMNSNSSNSYLDTKNQFGFGNFSFP